MAVCWLSARTCSLLLESSPQTVYLWVERRQIPHLRMTGRNIRFLKSDLEFFRSTCRQDVMDATAQSIS
jgi:excisionase family DNA binding protein